MIFSDKSVKYYCCEKRNLLCLLLLLLLRLPSFTQETDKISTKTKFQELPEKLEKALQTKDNARIASAYEELGDEHAALNNLIKAEENYKKSILYLNSKKDAIKLGAITRKLATIQEAQNKNEEARKNFDKALDYNYESNSIKDAELNQNDMMRNTSNTSIPKQKANIEQKIVTIQNVPQAKQDTIELARSYEQLGDVNIQEKKYKDAIENYAKADEVISQSAIPNSTLKPKIQEALLNTSDIKFSIEQSIQMYTKAEQMQNHKNQIDAALNLAKLYEKNNELNLAEPWYRKSFELSKTYGTVDYTIQTLENLNTYYTKHQMTQKAISSYKSFIADMPDIVQRDSIYLDKTLLDHADERIKKLEESQKLQEKILVTKNRFNQFLILSLVVLCFALTLLYRAYQAIQKKNKKIALQSLRREMNPHFIFNSLNSVNQFISTHNEKEANAYLTKFSQLMRKMMEQSNHDFILLEHELEILKNYLDLEQQRFNQKFDYSIHINPDIEASDHWIPNMILQPHLENSIWHGIRYIETKGEISISISKTKDYLLIQIEDNGIGVEKSKKLKTTHQKQITGRGSSNVKERIQILNELYNYDIHLEEKEKSKINLSGMIYKLRIPLKLNIK